MNTATELMQAEIKDLQSRIARLEDLGPQFAQLDRSMRTVNKFVNSRYMIIHSRILVCVKVAKITGIEPVIETLQEDLGIEFDGSSDSAEQGWRSFYSTAAPWIRVDAELIADGPECRRVITGYKQTPIYEIKCGDDATPDATPDAHGGTD
jgi:hypothetical protein